MENVKTTVKTPELQSRIFWKDVVVSPGPFQNNFVFFPTTFSRYKTKQNTFTSLSGIFQDGRAYTQSSQ